MVDRIIGDFGRKVVVAGGELVAKQIGLAKDQVDAAKAQVEVAKGQVTAVKAQVDRAVAAATTAESERTAAQVAKAASEAARDAAILAGRVFPTTAAGVAASTDGQYFVVPGAGSLALTLYRRENGAGVAKVEFPSLSGLSGFGTVAPVAIGVQVDQAVALNAALANARKVILPPGVTWIGRTVEVPADTVIEMMPGAILRALPTFTILNGKNHGVLLAGSRAGITGGVVDMNKRGIGEGINNRYNGITVLDGARDCYRHDVIVANCTGYGVYDSGAAPGATMPSSYNTFVRTLNCEIHFEPQAADGSKYIDCSARMGDGDIACQSFFHPLVGSKNITFVRCTGIGAVGLCVEATGNIAKLNNIRFIDCEMDQLSVGGPCFAVNDQGGDRIKVSGGRYTAIGNTVFSTGATDLTVRGAVVEGLYGFTSNGGSTLRVSDTDITLRTNVGSEQALFAATGYGAGDARIDGGSITIINGGEGSRAGDARVSADTKVTPAPAAGGALSPVWQSRAIDTFSIDGGATGLVDFDVGAPIPADPSKWHMSFSLQRIDSNNYIFPSTVNFEPQGGSTMRARIYFNVDFPASNVRVRWKYEEYA